MAERIAIIGDVHGRDDWKKIIDKEWEKNTHFVFIGDYFDNFPQVKSREKILKNFDDIIAYKKNHPDRITLLIGNHDYHYLGLTPATYSGYDKKIAPKLAIELKTLVRDKHLQAAFQRNDILVTHAGVSHSWAVKAGIRFEDELGLAKQINETFHREPRLFEFSTSLSEDTDPGGDNIWQSPFWIRPRSLLNDWPPVQKLVQVVGHTPVQKVMQLDDKLVLCDAHKDKKYPVITETNVMKLESWG